MPEQREPSTDAGVVAVFNTTPDALMLLRMALEHAGFVVAGGFISEIADGVIDLDAFVREHQPHVVIYDVAPPYEAQWRRLQRYKAMPCLAGCAFVLTSTSKAYVERLAAGDAQVFAVLDTPYDLEVIVRVVRDALRSQSS